MSESNIKENSNSGSLHLKYWLFISILILIAVATDRWSSQPKFTEYLSNAATMTSLMLGLVAILYSFVANNGLSESLGNISVVSEDVRKSKDQIAEYLTKTKAVTDASEGNRVALENISSTLAENLVSLRSALEVVAAQTGELPGRLEQLESTFAETAKTLGAKPAAPAVSAGSQARFWTDTAVKRFLERQTLSANLISIACVLAHKSGVELNLTDILNASKNEKLSRYGQGVLATMHASQIISRQLVPTKTGVYKVTSVDPYFADFARKYFVEYIERTFSGGDKEEWLSKLSAVEALFP